VQQAPREQLEQQDQVAQMDMLVRTAQQERLDPQDPQGLPVLRVLLMWRFPKQNQNHHLKATFGLKQLRQLRMFIMIQYGLKLDHNH
jgi:hypothetical protein